MADDQNNYQYPSGNTTNDKPPPAYSEITNEHEQYTYQRSDAESGGSGDQAGEDAPPQYELTETRIDMPAFGDCPPPPAYTDPDLTAFNPPSASQGVPMQVPRLSYADFLPRCIQPGNNAMDPRFEDFKVVMSVVNDWLSRHCMYQVLKCESIERKTDAFGNVETETTIYHESGMGATNFVRGIRLWLVPNNANFPPQKLWYINVVPKAMKTAMPMVYGPGVMMMGGPMFYGYRRRCGFSPMYTMFPSFEDLDKTLLKLNEKFRDDPPPGKILTVETVECKYYDAWTSECLDLDTTYWKTKGNTMKLYLNTLKVFFVVGPKQPVEINIVDFVPDCTTKNTHSAMAKPRFEPYTTTIERVGGWLGCQNQLHVTNIQTISHKIDMNLIGGDFKINTRKMHSFQMFETTFIKGLRICHISPGLGPPSPVLTSKSFVPIRFGRTKSETTSQTIARANQWLNITGAHVVGVDTLQYEFAPSNRGPIKVDQSTSTHFMNSGRHWITTFRLYFNGIVEEPPAEVLPPAPHYISTDQETSSECCTVL